MITATLILLSKILTALATAKGWNLVAIVIVVLLVVFAFTVFQGWQDLLLSPAAPEIIKQLKE